MNRKLTLGISVVALAVAVCLTGPAARATVITNSSGYITGISGLEVGSTGNYYDVNFLSPSTYNIDNPDILNTPTLYFQAFDDVYTALKDSTTTAGDILEDQTGGTGYAFASYADVKDSNGAELWYGASEYDDSWDEAPSPLEGNELDNPGMGIFFLASFAPAPSPGQGPCTPTPEPSTMLLFGIGLAGLAFVIRKRWSGNLADHPDMVTT